MSYAANKVIATVLRDPGFRPNAHFPINVEAVTDGINEQSDGFFSQIASLIADGLDNSDDTDGVDHAEVGRLVTEAIHGYIAGCSMDEIERAETEEVEFGDTLETLMTELRADDNAERARDMQAEARRAA